MQLVAHSIATLSENLTLSFWLSEYSVSSLHPKDEQVRSPKKTPCSSSQSLLTNSFWQGAQAHQLFPKKSYVSPLYHRTMPYKMRLSLYVKSQVYPKVHQQLSCVFSQGPKLFRDFLFGASWCAQSIQKDSKPISHCNHCSFSQVSLHFPWQLQQAFNHSHVSSKQSFGYVICSWHQSFDPFRGSLLQDSGSTLSRRPQIWLRSRLAKPRSSHFSLSLHQKPFGCILFPFVQILRHFPWPTGQAFLSSLY
jgi:hypothetical protein